jgi:hypothetical protein
MTELAHEVVAGMSRDPPQHDRFKQQPKPKTHAHWPQRPHRPDGGGEYFDQQTMALRVGHLVRCSHFHLLRRSDLTKGNAAKRVKLVEI